MKTRHMMEEATLEYAVTPEAKLLEKYYEAPGARQVEKFIKPSQFSLDVAPTLSPATNKRRKFNSPIQGFGYIQPQMRNGFNNRGGFNHGPARRSRRGGFNKNYRTDG